MTLDDILRFLFSPISKSGSKTTRILEGRDRSYIYGFLLLPTIFSRILNIGVIFVMAHLFAIGLFTSIFSIVWYLTFVTCISELTKDMRIDRFGNREDILLWNNGYRNIYETQNVISILLYGAILLVLGTIAPY